MKKLVVFAMLIASTSMVFGQTKKPAKKTTQTAVATKVVAEPAEPAKPITFDNYTIERSNIAKGTNDRFVFTFKNTGSAPLLIQEVQTSCGCTTAMKPEEPIAPGQKSEIAVKYDTFRVGNFEKTITIKTSAQPEPIVLTIKGNVLE